LLSFLFVIFPNRKQNRRSEEAVAPGKRQLDRIFDLAIIGGGIMAAASRAMRRVGATPFSFVK